MLDRPGTAGLQVGRRGIGARVARIGDEGGAELVG